MRLPRDLSGIELASLLQRYGYETTRQTGSHIRLTSTQNGVEHHVTVPAHKSLMVGTLSNILARIGTFCLKVTSVRCLQADGVPVDEAPSRSS